MTKLDDTKIKLTEVQKKILKDPRKRRLICWPLRVGKSYFYKIWKETLDEKARKLDQRN